MGAKTRRDRENQWSNSREPSLPAVLCSGPPHQAVSSLPMKRFERTSLHLLPGLQASATRMQFVWEAVSLCLSPPSPQSGPSPALLISASPAAASTPCPIHQSRRLGITFAFSRFCRTNNSAKIARLWLPPCPIGISCSHMCGPSAQALISGHLRPTRS